MDAAAARQRPAWQAGRPQRSWFYGGRQRIHPKSIYDWCALCEGKCFKPHAMSIDKNER